MRSLLSDLRWHSMHVVGIQLSDVRLAIERPGSLVESLHTTTHIIEWTFFHQIHLQSLFKRETYFKYKQTLLLRSRQHRRQMENKIDEYVPISHHQKICYFAWIIKISFSSLFVLLCSEWKAFFKKYLLA